MPCEPLPVTRLDHVNRYNDAIGLRRIRGTYHGVASRVYLMTVDSHRTHASSDVAVEPLEDIGCVHRLVCPARCEPASEGSSWPGLFVSLLLRLPICVKTRARSFQVLVVLFV